LIWLDGDINAIPISPAAPVGHEVVPINGRRYQRNPVDPNSKGGPDPAVTTWKETPAAEMLRYIRCQNDVDTTKLRPVVIAEGLTRAN
jgi:hypothetical protein